MQRERERERENFPGTFGFVKLEKLLFKYPSQTTLTTIGGKYHWAAAGLMRDCFGFSSLSTSK